MARSLRSLRQVALLRHGHMARRSASVRSCIQGTSDCKYLVYQELELKFTRLLLGIGIEMGGNWNWYQVLGNGLKTLQGTRGM